MSESADRRMKMSTLSSILVPTIDACVLVFCDIDSVLNALSFEIDKVR